MIKTNSTNKSILEPLQFLANLQKVLSDSGISIQGIEDANAGTGEDIVDGASVKTQYASAKVTLFISNFQAFQEKTDKL